MKTKITIIILEVSDSPLRNGILPLKTLVYLDNKFPNKHITTKTIEDTLQEILQNCSNLDIRYCTPMLMDLIHEQGSNECEAVYVVKMPQGFISPKKNSYLIDIDCIDVKEQYIESIQRTPRSIHPG
jgi:hypothetical protein